MLKWKVAALLALLAFGTGIAQSQRLWDPPAINVFPDHDRAARNARLAPSILRDGELLFATRFNRLDGAGRPASTGDSKPTPRLSRLAERFTRASGPDSASCAGCHNQPFTGGSGDFVANVFVGAHFLDPPTESVGTETTNERNTISVLGAGAIEMLAREMTQDLRAQREAGRLEALATSKDVTVRLSTKGVGFGVVKVRPDGTFDQSQLEGIDNDLVLKPFGVKGVGVSLREFSIAALNHHHGIQAIERFGWERTGRRDFDEDGVENEFSIGQVTALTLFQALLPPPSRPVPQNAALRKEWGQGEKIFKAAGCADCHVPALKLNAREFSEPNPFNRPGTATPTDVAGLIRLPLPAGGRGSGVEYGPDGSLLVFAFSDLKRHKICDPDKPFFCNEKLRQDNVPTDQFLTAKLWDLALSAPYGHRGDCDTVSEVILNHGGEAAESRERFERLSDVEKKVLVRFLLTLGASRYQPPRRQHEGG
ncbi:MAG: hypothetical protein LC795_19795 [Acidobacteria bacterium]|nr:hypothetical protein [Acidobacteriota bacterium]